MFPQFHEMLGEVYTDVYDQADRIAEYVRTLDQYTPASLTQFKELSIIADETSPVVDAEVIFKAMDEDNKKFIDLLKQVFASSQAENEQGIANFIAERLDAHGKLGWKIRSIIRDWLFRCSTEVGRLEPNLLLICWSGVRSHSSEPILK